MGYSHAEGHYSKADGYYSHVEGLSNALSSSDYKQYQSAHKLDEVSEALRDISKAASIAGVSMQEALAALENFYKLGGNADKPIKLITEKLAKEQKSAETIYTMAKAKVEETNPYLADFDIPHYDFEDMKILEEAPAPDLDTLNEVINYVSETVQHAPQSKPTYNLKTKITLRYDTEQNWKDSNIILLRGEVGIAECEESNWGYHPRKIMIGNGSSTVKYFLENRHYITI